MHSTFGTPVSADGSCGSLAKHNPYSTPSGAKSSYYRLGVGAHGSLQNSVPGVC
uniref:Uncharacterized protein n=1 Tax=Arion vulgaris TaxID=1028688 RepID=A0A0B6ZDI3_9EUPU